MDSLGEKTGKAERIKRTKGRKEGEEKEKHTEKKEVTDCGTEGIFFDA